MVFQCRRCGKQWNEEGYCKDGTFYTLCDKCGAEVIKEWTEFLEKRKHE